MYAPMKEFFIKKKIKTYTANLAKHLHDPLYCEKLADMCRQVAQEESAAQYYQTAIKAYYHEESLLGEDKEFILKLCWKLLELDRLNELAHRTLGQEYCSIKEFDEAVELYKSFARELLQVKRYAEAIEQYRNALVLQPDDVGLHHQCFSLLWRLRRRKEAVQELRKIAELVEKKGNVAKALECYAKAVKIMPSDVELQRELLRLRKMTRTVEKPLRLVVNK